jgi:CDP-paratose 2-epimerase
VPTVLADIRDCAKLNEAMRGAKAVIHLAAQVAVTTSVADPVEDFEINARGTLNVLEAVRAVAPEAPLLFASRTRSMASSCRLRRWPWRASVTCRANRRSRLD